ncbi:CRISPR-associated endonuclease Cas2 [Desulfosediminicola sp.]|uniref:CRISPR-associated endonuclease Cas2 n=1 Tax=Desulfosediminicola sp. TaxID=2886825 RepID=UPI003AF31711
MTFGGLNSMWIVVMFDLPTTSKEERSQYSRFRKGLLANGYLMMQYSIYIRHCSSDENATVHINRVKHNLPPDGEVRIIKITDKQFGKIEVFFGKKRKKVESAPKQLSFF